MADVFISYARAERDVAEAVKLRLEAMGLSVFLDVDGLDGGDVFSEKLDREVKTAGIVLGLWSPVALARPWVQIECDIGKRRGVLIPVAIKPFRDMDVPAPFWNIQFVDLTDALDHADNPNWAKLQRSIARTLNRPDMAKAAPAPAPGAAPDWARTRPKDARVQQKGGGGALAAVLAIVVLLVAGGGAFFYFDPLKLGLLHTAAASPAPAPNPAGSPPAQSAPPAAPVSTQPNPLAAAVTGKWRPDGLTCADAVKISSAGDHLVLDYSGSLQSESIEGAEPDGTLRTRANGASFFYSVKDGTLTLRASDGSLANFKSCGS